MVDRWSTDRCSRVVDLAWLAGDLFDIEEARHGGYVYVQCGIEWTREPRDVLMNVIFDGMESMDNG